MFPRIKTHFLFFLQRFLSLCGIFVPDDLPALHLHLLVQPLPVTAALNAALPRATVGTGVEAAHALNVQTVTHVSTAGEKMAFLIIHLALGSHRLSADKKTDKKQKVEYNLPHEQNEMLLAVMPTRYISSAH